MKTVKHRVQRVDCVFYGGPGRNFREGRLLLASRLFETSLEKMCCWSAVQLLGLWQGKWLEGVESLLGSTQLKSWQSWASVLAAAPIRLQTALTHLIVTSLRSSSSRGSAVLKTEQVKGTMVEKADWETMSSC